MTSNKVISILEIIKTTYPLRKATAKTSWEICCIYYSVSPILHCSIYIYISIYTYPPCRIYPKYFYSKCRFRMAVFSNDTTLILHYANKASCKAVKVKINKRTLLLNKFSKFEENSFLDNYMFLEILVRHYHLKKIKNLTMFIIFCCTYFWLHTEIIYFIQFKVLWLSNWKIRFWSFFYSKKGKIILSKLLEPELIVSRKNYWHLSTWNKIMRYFSLKSERIQ